MDGASAIIGIVAFGLHVVHKVIEIVEKVKDAPKNITALRDDAVEIGSLLQQFQQSDVLKSIVVPSGRKMQGSADRLSNALKEIQSFVEEVSEDKQDGLLRVRKLKWFFRSGRCERLRGSLASLKSSMIAIMTASTSQTMLEFIAAHRISTEQQDEFRRDHLRWRTEQKAEFAVFRAEVMRMLTVLVLNGDSNTLMLCADSYAQSGHPDLSSATPKSVPDGRVHTAPKTCHCSSEKCHASHIASQSLNRPTTSINLPLQCIDPCGCCCHDTRLICASPYCVSPLFGNIFIPSSLYNWSLSSCNVQTCRQTQRNRQMAKIKFFFPSWFIAVDMKIRLEAFPVYFCLQTPHRVSNESPIFRAIMHADVEGVRNLLMSDQASLNDIDEKGRGVLHYAAEGLIDYSCEKVSRMFQLLVEAGAHTEWEEEEFQWTPLQFMQYLLHRGRHTDQSVSGPASAIQLHIAGPIFHEDAVSSWEDWVEKYNPPKAHRAVLKRIDQDVDLKDMLAISIADINAPCRQGFTPLEWGIMLLVLDTIEDLLECGADVHKGFPLHHIAWSGNVEALQMLVHRGVDINQHNKDGWRPIHCAAYHGSADVVEELLRIGGNDLHWDAVNSSRRAPIDEARRGRKMCTEVGRDTGGHDRIIHMLSDLHAFRSQAYQEDPDEDKDDSVYLRIPGSFPTG